MKVKVIEEFRDKHTKKIHIVNKVMEITKERYDEILTVGNFVEPIKEEPKVVVEKNATTNESKTKKGTKKTTKKAE